MFFYLLVKTHIRNRQSHKKKTTSLQSQEEEESIISIKTSQPINEKENQRRYSLGTVNEGLGCTIRTQEYNSFFKYLGLIGFFSPE